MLYSTQNPVILNPNSPPMSAGQPTTPSPYDWIERSLATIRKANWHRSVTSISGRGGASVMLAGRRFDNFASNDYLGLAGDDRLVEAAVAATREYGTGSTGSRLLSGHRPLHGELERAIADLKQTDDAIVFSSGYLANVGTIAALLGARDGAFCDAYNHSSLRNGVRLSGAQSFEYRHGDVADLERLLQARRSHCRRALIVTDGAFSMDGDLCPLPELLDLGDRYDCMVLVDEAHATGVFGATGSGCVEHFGCRQRPLIQMGTLSKALGSLGGYVAGSAAVVDYLRNRAPSWVYTTGLSPADAAAARTAIAIVRQEPQRRDRLWQHVRTLRDRLPATLPPGYTLLPSASPILCIQVRDVAAVLAAGAALQSSGLFVSAVRPPTVPSSRLRLTLMATHAPEQLDRLVTALATLPAVA